jgi:hypothetical protein
LAAEKAATVLADLGWDKTDITAVAHAVTAHSFSANIVPETLEARILQDADRLDAIGMVGAARCFYIAGRMGSGLYDPADPARQTSPARRQGVCDRPFRGETVQARRRLPDGDGRARLPLNGMSACARCSTSSSTRSEGETMRISELNFYPLKSGRGIALDHAEITAAGIPGDREMMVVDPTGMFITQRELQSLARLKVYPGTDAVRFAMEGQGEISVARPPTERRMETVVWKSSVNAALADDAANAVLSDWLGRDIRLVFFDDGARRVASPEWAGDNSPVTFADGYQVLVTTTGSLAALNADMAARGEGSVGMERFPGRTSCSTTPRPGRRTAGPASRSPASASISSSPAPAAS